MTPTEDLINEHKAIKMMLSIMSKIAENIKANKGYYIKDVEQIVDFLKTFADKCHHGKEENVLFPMANKTLSEQSQKEIFKQFEKIEEDIVGHGVHEQYHKLLNQLKIKYIG